MPLGYCNCRYNCTFIGKKVEVSLRLFDIFERETGFLFSYTEVGHLHRPNEPSNEIDRVSKFDNSLSFGAKQNALRQIFFALWFFKDLFTKNSNEIFFDFLLFCIGSIKEWIHVYLSMQIHEKCLWAWLLICEGVFEHFSSFSSLSSIYFFWFQIR